MAIQILHASDFHMDSPFDSLPPEKAALRRREQRRMLTNLSQLCRESGAQLLLLAGDLFDSAMAYQETQETLSAALASCGARVFISPGNHDWYGASSPYAKPWPENVHIFSSKEIEEVVLEDLGCRVCGGGYRMDHADSMLDGYHAPDDGLVNIGVLHGDLKDGPYAPIHESAIAASGLDYLALGHIHTFSGFLKAGNTVYAYPGCPEGRGFDECGEKGIIAGNIEKGNCQLRFLPMPGRRYCEKTVDLTGESHPEEAFQAVLPGKMTGDICRITFTGEAEAPDLNALQALAGDRFFHLILRDQTRPVRNIWEGLEEDTLKGAFLRILKAKYDRGEEETKIAVEKAVRYGLAALENREEPQL